MGEIAIKLNPQKLQNPDADVRYTISDRVVECFGDEIESNGFDYLEDGIDSLVIFLSSPTPGEDVKKVLNLLNNEQFCENWILDSAVVGIKENEQYQVVHPENYHGDFGV